MIFVAHDVSFPLGHGLFLTDPDLFRNLVNHILRHVLSKPAELVQFLDILPKFFAALNWII